MERNSAPGILDLHPLGEAAVQEPPRGCFGIRKWLIVGIQSKAVCVEH